MTNHDEYAAEYDSLALKYESYFSEIIFGLVYQHIKTEDKLLDLGIGTGLSSKLFHKAGLKISGIDISEKMLNICREKKIASDLKIFDLNQGYLPYSSQQFNHIIAVGLFNFFKDLDIFFKEANRVLKDGGTFSFTVKDSKTDISIEKDEEYDMTIFGHSDAYIEHLIMKYHFNLDKRVRFLTLKSLKKRDYYQFNAYVLKKI